MKERGPSVGPAILLIPLLFLSFCDQRPASKEGVVAEAYGETLTPDELEELIPGSLSGKDSQAVAEELINNWVRERVLLRKAEKELKPEEKDIEERVASYRRSLLVHSLESKVVEQELDSQVTEQQIHDFYGEHRKEFNLEEAILQADHVQLDKDSIRYLQRFLRAMRKDDDEGKGELRELCRKHATHCSLNDGGWKTVSRLLTETPLKIRDEEEFLKNRTLVREDLEEVIFLLRIRDHKLKNETTPLSLVKERIERMIIDRRKTEAVERFHQNALSDARKKKKVRIH